PASAAIRHRLAQLVAAENPADPLDDVALTALLSAEGMALARRTVAKFRQELGIPPRARRRQRA
ncbi:MAG: RNA polymerase sigma-54 factor, partial [Rhodobacteraceae bacterium]|nr:RNA polymerase sigma-54 factor [Paracoccaceae bacterium]